MSATINFMQALRELTGFEQLEEAEDNGFTDKGFTDKGYIPEPNPQPNSETLIGKINMSEPKIEKPKIYAESHGGSHITSSMVIHGNIKTSDDVMIDGAVYGNVEAGGNVAVKNIVVGDIKAQNASFTEAKIKGNITAAQKVAVDSAAIVVGNVNAGDITVSGKIKGDLKAGNTVVLKEDALVAGNILTGSFVSHPGARMRGSVLTESSKNFDDSAEFCLGVEEHEK